jgi:ribosomal protein S18 acetylase RimI-like enzyme
LGDLPSCNGGGNGTRSCPTARYDGDGELVGFVAHRVHPPSDGMSAYGEVVVIAVDPGARSRGVGKVLLDRAVADLCARGIPVIMVETGGDEGHAPARALYESAGFTRLPLAQYWLAGTTDAEPMDHASS